MCIALSACIVLAAACGGPPTLAQQVTPDWTRYRYGTLFASPTKCTRACRPLWMQPVREKHGRSGLRHVGEHRLVEIARIGGRIEAVFAEGGR